MKVQFTSTESEGLTEMPFLVKGSNSGSLFVVKPHYDPDFVHVHGINTLKNWVERKSNILNEIGYTIVKEQVIINP